MVSFVSIKLKKALESGIAFYEWHSTLDACPGLSSVLFSDPL